MTGVRYCLPIIKTAKAEVLETIQTNGGKYDYFEVWLDYVDGADEAFVKQLVGLLGDRLVILFRRDKLETIRMPLEKRFDVLKLLDKTPALVDLDITSQTAELDYIRENNLAVKTIVSYHDYQQTPPSVRLEEIIDTMERYQPGIYKLAALCGSHEDAVRLLEQLLALKAQGRNAIVLGMGEAGAVTRVFGALWGNEMTFAPLTKAEQSASGQLTRQQLENIFKELRG